MTEIDANTTTVTDQAGKKRRSVTNALGQLVRVDEPDAAGNLGTVSNPVQPTYYAYDALNNLTTVSQGVQTRTFTYNSLSRLISATNPESGTINYSYDANGNLTSKTDARGVVTSYVYDALNRVTQRSYSTPNGTPGVGVLANYQATPNVSYFYDDVNVPFSKGRLTKVTSSISETRYNAFDNLGRVLSSSQVTDGQTYNFTYTYNLSGALIEQTYPSGRVVKNVLESDGDLSMVQSKKTANSGFFNYAKHFTYAASGAVTSMRLGNGLWESTQFNSRLQPVQIGLGTSVASQNLFKLNYDYGTNDNNGNVLSQTITVPTVGQTPGFTAVQNYSYDSLNRLKSAVENVTPHGGSAVQSWKQTFTFDRYGNRRFDFANGNTTFPDPNCPEAICNPTISTANNRLTSTGWQYDAAGNTTADPEGRTFIYDGENKQKEVRDQYNTVIGQYFFDGDGRRVKKIVPATGEVTVFVYDASGKSIAEYSTVVESVENAKVAYLTSDHLGSPRINTDRDGNVTARHDYHPYGEKVYTAQRTAGLAYDADTVRKQFTSYERDNETDLDFAQARMFAHNHGRFTAPDPTLQSLRAENPQTLNRYVYVLNNPLRFVDPLGLWELEYNPEAEKEGDASKLKTIKIYFRKSKDGDNADSLLKQLGFSSKDKGYAEMKSQIEEAMKNMGELGIQASALKGKVDGVNVGEIFKVAGDRLADQAEFDLKEMQAGRAWNGRNGPQNDQYNDCSMTTMRLAFPGRMINERGIGEGTGIFNVGDADDMLPSTQVSGDSLRTGDIVRYQNNNTPTHFMTALFTGDDGITRGFSRSGVNGRYEVVPVQAFVGSPPNGYGNISGRGGRATGYYRP